MYLLYCKEKTITTDCNQQMEIKMHYLKDGLFLPYDIKKIHLIVKRLYLYMISKTEGIVFYVIKDNQVVHESFVNPNKNKFLFLKSNDCEIGPCFTNELYRGKGIYPNVLNFITSTLEYDNYYMIVDSKNVASIKGMIKANFYFYKTIKKNLFTKVYR